MSPQVIFEGVICFLEEKGREVGKEEGKNMIVGKRGGEIEVEGRQASGPQVPGVLVPFTTW